MVATASVPPRTILITSCWNTWVPVAWAFDRFVALKILPAEFAINSERRSRFIREAAAASALNHPGIVTAHEINTETDPPFIVLEDVDGKPLSGILQERRLKHGRT